ncbi:hypothetical protein AM571_CH01433 [Rhizobium etli 8C-3]|uniref:Uncharacterized protein n=1 Tax=Rhizobium etli 8C-3 TaxID=538025 RepID=A0A1L5P2A5_RHIET|nr:hypothetical protein [Rhizobium etli]APO74268.1 hypothetical protein AM571_CH01433 [Rhizobium etli 8C-3]
MAHVRSQAFAAVKAQLAAIPEFAGAGKVARGRAAAIPQELLPALTLTWAEANEAATMRPCSGPNGEDGYDRQLPLSIIIHLRDDDPEEEFDRICVLVESAMGGDILLGGTVIEALLQTSRFYVNPQTGLALCVGVLNYMVSYKTVAANPEITAA